MSQELTVVVTGSTGKQGGAVARRLLERGLKVRAVTRDPNSSQAKLLSSFSAPTHSPKVSAAYAGTLGTQAYAAVRAKSPKVTADRLLAPDINAISALIDSGLLGNLLH